jgi:hypothetical protein
MSRGLFWREAVRSADNRSEAMIEVKQTGHSNPLTFNVVIQESGKETRHQVTMSVGDYDRLELVFSQFIEPATFDDPRDAARLS